jgi:hypothetical protein
MESEQSQNFNERLSQWVSNQGFWFQLRYSLSGSGSKGTAMFHLIRMGFRVMVFLLLVVAGLWIYLVKRTEYGRFKEGFNDSIKTGLSASAIELRGFSRSQGELGISRVALQGDNRTFFTTLEARNIRCRMGMLDGLTGKWDTGIVSVSRLEMDLRAGADDAESARLLSEALFKKSNKVEIGTMEVADASLRWGYSERTRGSIENSTLRIQRLDNKLKLTLKGGTFSQNWLRGLEIVNMEISCDPQGMVFEKAELRKGAGTVDFSGLKVTGGERPVLEGALKIRKLGLEQMLPLAHQSFVEGSISGDFRITGSTNTTDGLGFSGMVTLDGRDTLTLRKRLHLLQALSDVDYVRNYHRVDFTEGSFRMKTLAGGMEISDLALKAADLFTLEGRMRVRLPTPEEMKAEMENAASVGGDSRFPHASEESDNYQNGGDSDFTLRRAAQEAKRVKEGTQQEAPDSLFSRLGLGLEIRRLEAQAAERISRTLRYEGLFRITLLPDAFERAPKLVEQFPVDPASGRIPMMVPIEGDLYELTLKQAEEIYQQRSR